MKTKIVQSLGPALLEMKRMLPTRRFWRSVSGTGIEIAHDCTVSLLIVTTPHCLFIIYSNNYASQYLYTDRKKHLYTSLQCMCFSSFPLLLAALVFMGVHAIFWAEKKKAPEEI